MIGKLLMSLFLICSSQNQSLHCTIKMMDCLVVQVNDCDVINGKKVCEPTPFYAIMPPNEIGVCFEKVTGRKLN